MPLILMFVPFHNVYLFFSLSMFTYAETFLTFTIKLVWPQNIKLVSPPTVNTLLIFNSKIHNICWTVEITGWCMWCIFGRHEKDTFSMHGRLDFLGSKYRYLSKWPTIKTCKLLQFLIFYQLSHFYHSYFSAYCILKYCSRTEKVISFSIP